MKFWKEIRKKGEIEIRPYTTIRYSSKNEYKDSYFFRLLFGMKKI